MRRGRIWWAGLVAIAVGCSSAPPIDRVCTPGESRACTCSSGAMGAQVCVEDGARLGPCECRGDVDASTALDAGPVPVDAGRLPDAGRDAGRDSGPPDAGPPWGTCWLVPQAGCAEGEACRNLPRSEGPETWPTAPPSGAPGCEPAGYLGEWETLSDASRCLNAEYRDVCAAGLFCYYRRGCYRYCDPDGEPCPPARDGSARACVSFTLPTGTTYWHCERR